MSSKNELQEFLQQHGLPFPLYYQLSKSGEAHSPSFVCEVRVKWKDGQELAETGEGRKKREAEQLAAKKMLRSIKNIESEGHAASPEVRCALLNYGWFSMPCRGGSATF